MRTRVFRLRMTEAERDSLVRLAEMLGCTLSDAACRAIVAAASMAAPREPPPAPEPPPPKKKAARKRPPKPPPPRKAERSPSEAVPCRHCGAKPGQRCATPGGQPLAHPHKVRRADLGKARAPVTVAAKREWARLTRKHNAGTVET